MNNFEYSTVEKYSNIKKDKSENDKCNSISTAAITFLLTVEYDGTEFCGFQRTTRLDTSSHPTDISLLHRPFQNRGRGNRGNIKILQGNKKISTPSVQDALERALYQLGSTRQPIATFKVRSVGRTDKGVHAKQQMVCFDYNIIIDSDDLQRKYTPNDMDFENERKNTQSQTKSSQQPPMKKKKIDASQISTNKREYNHLFRICADLDKTKEKPTHEEELKRAQNMLVRSFNSYLPEDVAVKSIRRCRTNLQPRQEPSWKTYAYRIRYNELQQYNFHNNGTIHMNEKCHSNDNDLDTKIDGSYYGGVHSIRTPFDHTFIWTCPWALNTSILNETCKQLCGYHDYSNFVHKKERKTKSNIMTIHIKTYMELDEVDLQKPANGENGMATYSINDHEAIRNQCASLNSENNGCDSTSLYCNTIRTITIRFTSQDGFRRSMVRNLTGFITDMSRNKYEKDKQKSILSQIFNLNDMNNTNYIHAAPACGLCLEKVHFINNVYSEL